VLFGWVRDLNVSFKQKKQKLLPQKMVVQPEI